MKDLPDFPLFCPACRRHYEAGRTVCPRDGMRLAEVPTTRPRAGNVFDSRFVILETIGKGGMATIYRGFDIPRRRQVALKVLKTRFSAEERAVSQFFTEARVARRLRHDNIIRTFDYGRTEAGYLYIAMELLAGSTLSRLIRAQHVLEPVRAVHIFAQIVDALAAAHARGTIHRDLKPENVVVYRDNGGERVKLLDFGIAQFAGTTALPSRDICGTPAYMSPEQIRGKKVTPAADLYSAGIVLFEMLTGQQPFTGPSPMEILKRQLKSEAPDPLALNESLADHPDLVAIVRKLLAKKAADRYLDAGTVQQALLDLKLPSYGRPRVVLPAPPPHQDDPIDTPLAVVSYNEESPQDQLADAALAIVPLESGAMELLLDTHVRPGILLEEALSIHLDDATQEAVPVGAPELEEPPISPVPGCIAERYTLLHVRFAALDGARDDIEHIEAVRSDVEEHLEPWFEYVSELGGLLCYDNGSELKVVFGYLTENEGHVISCLDAARALSLQVEHQAIRRGKPVGVKMGVATGVVYADQGAEMPLDWLIKGSEIDLAVRLSRLAPVGGVLLCQNTALRAQPNAELHPMARVSKRGGEAVGTFLLKGLSRSRDVDSRAREPHAISAPAIGVPLPRDGGEISIKPSL